MTMLRVLITQKNEDGSIKTKNGKQQLGGVIYDRMGDALGYVFEERKYDYKTMERKPEFFVENWYNGDGN